MVVKYEKVIKWRTKDNYGNQLDYRDLLLMLIFGMIPILNIILLISFLFNKNLKEVYYVKKRRGK